MNRTRKGQDNTQDIMTSYSKICAICSKSFFSQRISAAYCRKSCANKARYMPDHLVTKLIQRNSAFTIKATEISATVEDSLGNEVTLGYVPEGATKEHPLGKDEGYLIGLATLAKEKLLAEQRHKELLDNKSNGFNNDPINDSLIDPEMKDFVLEDDEDTVDDLPDTVGLQSLQPVGSSQTQESQDSYGVKAINTVETKSRIRRIGEKQP